MTTVIATDGSATLELETVDGEPPAISITVSGVATSTTFTLTRLCDGKSLIVPGWTARTFTDSDVTVDWVAPLNRPITYTLSANGTVVTSATITLTSDTAWLHDPLQPEKSIPVRTDRDVEGYLTMRGDALKNVDYNGSNSQLIQVMGAPEPVSLGGQVAAGSKINASMRSVDPATASRMRDLRSEAPLLLLRTSTDMVPLPALAYLRADVSEQPVDVHMGGSLTRWVVTGDLVKAVMQVAISGFVTNDQVQQLLAGITLDQVQAKYSGLTNLDVQKNPLIYQTL